MNELKKCKEMLDHGLTWECLCNNKGMVKMFVSKAYGGIDFDDNFKCRLTKNSSGQMVVSVRKKN